jgi:hypothetical protein
MIPTDVKAHIRERFALLALDTEVDIYRNLPESDGSGGVKTSFRKIASNVPARIQSGTAGVRAVRMDQSQLGQSMQSVAFVQIVLPHGTDIRTQDRIFHKNEKYEIGHVDQARSEAILRVVRANVYREK